MAPTIVKNNITATGNAEVVVTAAMLQATSTGIAEAQLVFTVNGLPSQGGLKLNGTALAVNGTFTQADIMAGKLTYLPTGAAATDGFGFTVTDGTSSGTTQAISTSKIFGSEVVIFGDPVFSADGRYILATGRSNTVGNPDQINLFLYDLQTTTVSRIPVGIGGTLANPLLVVGLDISGDGRYVVFESKAPNLVPEDKVADSDIFLHDRQTGTTKVISVSSSGIKGNGVNPSISKDGRYITFQTNAKFVANDRTDTDVYVYDQQTAKTTLVSESSVNNEDAKAVLKAISPDGFLNGESSSPIISANGRYVVFNSDSKYLLAKTDSDVFPDVFVRDLQTGITEQISTQVSTARGSFRRQAISGDGRYVVFSGGDDTSETFIRDRQTGTTQKIDIEANPNAKISLSEDGRYLSFESKAVINKGVFTRDLQTGNTTKAATDFLSYGDSRYPGFTISALDGKGQKNTIAVSKDGRYTAYSKITVIPPGINQYDLYLDDRGGSGGVSSTSSTSATAAIAITPGLSTIANNTPIATSIAAQSIISGNAISFPVPANTFTDADAGDVLTYSAKLADGNNLPTWLTFNATTNTFAGTPAAANAGNLNIAVTATDKAGLKVASNFALNITAAVVAPPIGSTTVNFGSPNNFAVATNPTSVTVGDFNGDGISDLVTANSGESNNVSVVLGDGKGSFGNATNFAVGRSPNFVTVGDFNRDGISDLATVNLSSNVSILLGDGKGSFGTATNFDVGSSPNSVAVGDFNGDGISDLATGNSGSTKVSVVLGNGKGSFGTATNFDVGINPVSVKVGDFNGDGISDLATANGSSNDVSVLLGDGKGSFGLATNLAVGNQPDSLTIGDFNGDGISDLATANAGSKNLSVILGNNKGNFGTAANFAVGSNVTFVTVGDFNGDGISDLATANPSSLNISVLLGNGKGSFGTATNFALVKRGPKFLTVGDFNGDGSSDLATANGGEDISVLLNQTTNTPKVTIPTEKPSVIVTEEKPPVVITPETSTPPKATESTPPNATIPKVVTPEVLIPTTVVEPIIEPVIETVPIKNNNPAPNERNPIISNPDSAANLSNLSIPGIAVENNLFKTSATTKGFGISAVSQKATNKVNEIGIFAVDDASGKIGSIAPGTPEYLKAALDIAKPIFTSLAGDFLNKVNQEFSIDPNKTYQFFEIQDGSIADARQQISNGKSPTNLLFSIPDSKGNSPIKVTNNSNNDGYQISVNSDELVLNVVKLVGANVNSPIGTKSQSAPEGRTIDLTDYAGQTLKADITTTSSAAYSNNVGFYAVEDAIGTIKLADGSFVKPGDANYAIEAIKSALTNSLQAGKTDSQVNINIGGGKIYAPVVVSQSTLANFAATNPTNSGFSNVHAYFNYIGANSDKVDHFRLIGNNTFGVEDIYGGGDRDFNDLVVNMNVKTAA
jgi:Putative Ig domain/FG-GAP-like repeat/Cadherin-like/Domain of unknown function (DUF4114)/WD40-like Beta Propeller Repeat